MNCDNCRYENAIQAYTDAMKIISAEHPSWPEIVNNLADVYRKRGNYAEARQLYSRALSTLESTYGDYHPLISSQLDPFSFRFFRFSFF